MKAVEYLVIHDSDSKYANPFIIDAWHKARGFKYDHVISGTPIHVGYHFIILNGYLFGSDRYQEEWDGLVVPCRPESVEGSHCFGNGRNEDSLGICLVGPRNVGETDEVRLSAAFTRRQMVSLSDLVLRLKEKYKIPSERVVGHKEQDSQKSDPRFDMQALRFFLNQT